MTATVFVPSEQRVRVEFGVRHGGEAYRPRFPADRLYLRRVVIGARYYLFESQALLRTLDQRGQWVRLVARRRGRIEGSVRSRTLYL